MADGVGHRALGGLGGILAMNINAHAHFGNTAHACHRFFAFVRVRGKSISEASFAPRRSKRKLLNEDGGTSRNLQKKKHAVVGLPRPRSSSGRTCASDSQKSPSIARRPCLPRPPCHKAPSLPLQPIPTQKDILMTSI